MPLPKFSDLSSTVQIVVILVVGAALWGVSEYLLLKPLNDANTAKRGQVTALEAAVAPLRPYREKVRALEADNRQLENQLTNLRRIVPNDKEVDNFIRLLQSEAATAGVALRRFSSRPQVVQQYYVEVPVEIELDGSFYDVLQFYDRLGRVERITNVSDLKMDALITTRGTPTGRFNYSANETVSAVCTVTTFFSKEDEGAAAAPGAPGAAAKPPAAPVRR
jgi:type IV pilus assembly protein PilO